ncbi:MAG TPA: FAD-dependent monooxygenase [Kineosporiaceae bacterium]
MTAPGWARRRVVVVVGARLSGAVTAHALAPWSGDVLLVERTVPGRFWPQQVTWDRRDNLLWAGLGLLDTVLGCGAPRLRGHTRRTMDSGPDGAPDVVVECRYPDDDEYCYRMSIAREVLDPALAARAAQHGNVQLLRPARVVCPLLDGGRVRGVVVEHQGVRAEVPATLVVLADGRRSRLPGQVGAHAYDTVASPWSAMLAYHRGLPLPADHTWYTRRPGSMLIVTPTGPDQWCVAAALHADLIAGQGGHPVRVYHRTVAADPVAGPAVAAGTAMTPVGGATRLGMHRRPMAGPGWCLVGDSGLHLDPMSALGGHAALVTAQLLQARVADLGGVSADPTHYADLTTRRDALLRGDWEATRRIISSYQPAPEAVERARRLAGDPAALDADVRARMGLPARAPVVAR